MYFSLITAISKNLVIGKDNKLPWHFPSDMKFFRQTTTGKTVVMGRKTFNSLNSKPLPNRLNIVISSQSKPENIDSDIIWLNNPKYLNAQNLPQLDGQEVFIIGGSSLYQYFLDKSRFLYLTLIDREYEGDSCFPKYDHLFTSLVSSHTILENNTPLTFYKYQNPTL